jgi:hypothetical protein
MELDFGTLTLVGLVAYGTVHVVSFFRPTLDPRVKFFLSFVVAFAVAFVPAELGNIVLEKAKEALAVALLMSGASKLADKAGGKA